MQTWIWVWLFAVSARILLRSHSSCPMDVNLSVAIIRLLGRSGCFGRLGLTVLIQYADHLRRGKLAVIILVDHHGRRQKTGPETGHGFKGKLIIRAGLALLQVKLFFHHPQNTAPAFHMTGRAPTDANHIPTLGL